MPISVQSTVREAASASESSGRGRARLRSGCGLARVEVEGDARVVLYGASEERTLVTHKAAIARKARRRQSTATLSSFHLHQVSPVCASTEDPENGRDSWSRL